MMADIAAAFNTVEPTLKVGVSKGFENNMFPSGANVEQEIRAGNIVRTMLDLNPRPDFEIAKATRSKVSEGYLMIYAYAKDPGTALDALRAWWLLIAGDDGKLLNDIEGKVTLGNVEFLHWRAVGGFQGFAEKNGNVWYVDQMVQYAARVLP